MTDFALDDLDRARLDWPEPILIDLISDHYASTPGTSDRIAAARLHVRFLHELIEGEPRRAAFQRLELIACCTPRGISIQAIEIADDAAFRELRSLVEGRFRNSMRMRLHFLERLDDAFARLPERSDAHRPRATVRVLASARSNWDRPATHMPRRLVANG